MSRDYKETCLLPRTAFAMKADLFKREPQWLQRWESSGLYAKILARPPRDGSAGRFVFHDGPPYANGHMHYGHILNNALKDFVTRSRSALGAPVKFVPGWDTHGLPIELNVDRELKRKGKVVPTPVLRRLCREEALRWVDVQRVERKRLGVLGTWDTPYLTLHPQYEGRVIEALRAFVAHGIVYRGKKPVQWSWGARTALAEAEVEYDEAHVSPSVYVRFDLDEASAAKVRARLGVSHRRISALIWTTTPWTLPANLAIALHPALVYTALTVAPGEAVLVAKGLAESVVKACRLGSLETAGEAPGADLAGLVARHPFEDRGAPLLLADYVDDSTGTGLVHTAPGHGRDDYSTGQKHGLEAYAPVDEDARYTAELGAGAKALGLEGQFVFDANPVIAKHLAAEGFLLNRVGDTVTHKYPICWRTKTPLITRATTQWFIAMDAPMAGDPNGQTLRQLALAEIDRLHAEGQAAHGRGEAAGWVPAWGYERIRAMIAGRPDWCISRQRAWGVPIPAVHHVPTGEVVLTTSLLDHTAAAFAAHGADAWYGDDPSACLPEFIALADGSLRPRAEFSRDPSILDVWFESGSSFYAVCGADPAVGLPVDLYLEGSDQHRGWFHSSLLVGCAVLGRAPYNAVLTHGFVCDEHGRPYSKSDIRRRQEARRDLIVERVEAGESLDAVLVDLKSAWAAPDKLAEARKRLGKKVALADVALAVAEDDIEFIPPEKIIQEQGAELFRAWAAFVDYENDMPYSRAHLGQAIDGYRRVRNTVRFLLGALREEAAPEVETVALEPLDRWALARLGAVMAGVAGAYRRYAFRSAFAQLLDFTQELSAFYLDASKDWLYNDGPDSPRRVSCVAVMQRIARDLAVALGPLLPFSAEDIWDHLPATPDKPESVHLAPWPEASADPEASALVAAMEVLRRVREASFGALEPLVQAWGVEKQAAKKEGREAGTGPRTFSEAVRIDHPRDAALTVTLPATETAALGPFASHAAELLGVGSLDLVQGQLLRVEASRAAGPACARCWRRRPDVATSGLCTRCAAAVRIFDQARPAGHGE